MDRLSMNFPSKIILLFAIAFQVVHGINPTRKITTQQRLMRKLFNNSEYDPRARPVPKLEDPVKVTVRLNLYQLIEVDERSQFVILYAWNTQMWKDYTLAWDPRDYDDMTSIVVPYDQIWLPDTYLYNSLKMSRKESERWISAILEVDNSSAPSHNDHSRVIFRYPALYKFMCSMDVKYFPFDTQHCRMVFGSWTFDASGIVFMPEAENVAREDYQENEEWTVISLTAKSHFENYSCCPHPFSFVYVDFVLQRRPLHYLVNLFVPILIVAAIANIGFFTPSTTDGIREQKISLGMSTLVALSIILMMVSDQMPTTSTSVPLVGQFFVAVMVQTALGSLATTAILLVHQRGLYGHTVPPWVKRTMFDKIAPWLGVERLQPLILSNLFSEHADDDDTPIRSIRRSELRRSLRRSVKQKAVARLSNQMVELRYILGKKYKDLGLDSDPNLLDWEFLASILDRLFLLISLIGVGLMCGLFVIFGFLQSFFDS